MPKSASIYERKGILYVSASHKTQAGFWIGDSDIKVITAHQNTDIVNAVEAALIHSLDGVPTPPPSAKQSASLLAAAGVASWNTFTKAARYVGVYQTDDTILVTPYKNLGGKEGFEPMDDRAISLPLGDAGLAAALSRALEMAD